MGYTTLRGKLDALSAISDRAEKENRKFTEDEQSEYDDLKRDYERQKTRTAGDSLRAERHEMFDEPQTRVEWRDQRTGAIVPVLSRRSSFVDHVAATSPDSDMPHPSQLSLGRAIVAQLRGNWSGAENEQRALSEGSNIAGGYLVPEWLSANVIDKARAISVLMRAGAKTVPMQGETLSIARVATDPTMTSKGENAAFTPTSIVFDSVNLISHTLGCLIEASREIIEDAPNSSAIIEQTLALKLAQHLDSLGLAGNGGSDGILGINAKTGIQTTAIGGAVDWDNILDAVEDVRDSNAEAGAMILTPALKTSLSKLKNNSEANNYSRPPADVEQLRQLVTTGQDSGVITVGNFSELLWGIRQDPRVEVSTESGDAFKKHQVHIKVTFRGDVVATHADQSVTLTGAT